MKLPTTAAGWIRVATFAIMSASFLMSWRVESTFEFALWMFMFSLYLEVKP